MGARFLAVTTAGVIGLTSLLATAAPSYAGQRQALGGVRALRPGDRVVPRPPRGAVRLGTVAPGALIRVDVTLKLPDPAALRAFIAAVSDRRSPLFHHFLEPGQFAQRFGPPRAEVRAVDGWLRAAGLSPRPASADRLAIPVAATAAVIERAFAISLVRYRLPGGRIAYANSAAPRLPAAIARHVNGVLGLSNLYLPRSLAARPRRGRPVWPAAREGQAGPVPDAAGPKPCAAASNAAAVAGSFTADRLASHYAMSPMYGLGDFGQGVHVAMAEFEPNSPADVAAYKACYGVTSPVSYVRVDGGAGSGPGSGEAALDIDNVMGLAPGAAIEVYQAPNGGSANTYDLYSAIINNDTAQVVSTSWGQCELDSDQSLITAEHTLFAQADSQGQTVFASAGDAGSTDCYGDGSSNGAALSVDDPASQPYVLGVGGTTIGASSETAWNDSSVSAGAGGGGLSAEWCMPSYQYKPAIPGLIGADSGTDATDCGTAVPYIRQVPDVAADADPGTGYVIMLNGSWQGGWGGTSAAAPLWAAVAALTDASPFCSYYGSGNPGVLPEGLYANVGADPSYVYTPPPEALKDVASGTNDYTPSGYIGGLYPATRGYDMASGLGTPLVSGFAAPGQVSMFYPGLAAWMCWAYGTKLGSTHITAVTPRQGPSARRQTVTVSGTGFLPVPGADMAKVGAVWVGAKCASTTRCTVILPRRSPGTVDIRISAEDFTLSPVTRADRYRYVAAPRITSLSPGGGPARGGTRVIIRGKNFIAVTAVRFGSKRATRVRVISATKIIVTAPAGTGTVRVKVTAAGGTSARVTADRYRYR